MIVARQYSRYELSKELEKIFLNENDENQKKEKARLKIYEMITILQNRYRKVIDEYNNLKSEYLK